MNFADARDYCRTQKGSLVRIAHPAMQQEMYNKVNYIGQDRIWIGLYRDESSDNDRSSWNWKFDGFEDSPLKVSYWGPGEPNNYLGRHEGCVEIRRIAKTNMTNSWNDIPCQNLNQFFCQVKR